MVIIKSPLLFVPLTGLVDSSKTRKARANSNPPRPSFQERVNEYGNIIKAQIIGIARIITVYGLGYVCSGS
jgi:hypothetical protein